MLFRSGMIIGLIVALNANERTLYEMGLSKGVFVFFAIFIGGVFIYYIKAVWREFQIFGNSDFGDISGPLAFGRFMIVSFIWLPIKSVYMTIKKIISYIIYLKQTSTVIASDSNAIRQMEEFMEYYRIRLQDKEADLETLINKNTSLDSNSFVRVLRANGEENADSMIRQATMTISENGEIVRSFAG